MLNCTEYSAVVLQLYAVICKCIPYSTNRLLAKISVCRFQGSGIDDIAVSSLLPLITPLGEAGCHAVRTLKQLFGVV